MAIIVLKVAYPISTVINYASTGLYSPLFNIYLKEIVSIGVQWY